MLTAGGLGVWQARAAELLPALHPVLARAARQAAVQDILPDPKGEPRPRARGDVPGLSPEDSLGL